MKIARMAEVDFTSLTSGETYTPSPTAWEDQVFYFLMVDRFSDGKESNYRDNNGAFVAGGSTPLFTLGQACNISREEWVSKGQGWKGGNLKGMIGKLGYLQRMGITSLWVSPIFKQVNFLETYHGYGIQNFLELDPHLSAFRHQGGAGHAG